MLSVWFSEIDKEMHTLLYCTSHNLIADCRRRNRDYNCHILDQLGKEAENSMPFKRGEKRKDLGSAQDGLRQD